jgi:hypothetical protein
MNFVPKRRLLLPAPTWQEDKAYSDFFADGVAASRKVHSRSSKDAIRVAHHCREQPHVLYVI